MTERYTGIPENQKIARVVPEGGQAKATGQASEQNGSARENIHNLYMDRQQWLRSSRQGTLAEIRDSLRRQEISRELEEMATFRANLDEKINRKREETLAASPEERARRYAVIGVPGASSGKCTVRE
jgi:hypothetical protein